MKSNKKIESLVKFIQIFLGIVFIFSGYTKLADLNLFAEAIANFKILSEQYISFVKYIIPIMEVIIGIGIIFNFKSSFPTFAATLLLSFFTSLIAVKLFEGEEISCGCFGALSHDTLDEYSLLRNIVLIIVSALIAFFYDYKSIQKKKNSNKTSIKNSKYKIIKNIIFYNIFFFIATQNLIFALQNKGLKTRLALLVNDHNILKKDELVKSFEINSLEDYNILVEYNLENPKSTLIFIFKPTCLSCKLNLPNWISLFNKIDTSYVRILPISIADQKTTLKYVVNNNIPFKSFYTKEDRFLLDYKAFITPQTILISNEGKVINIWKGILDKTSIREIINFLTN